MTMFCERISGWRNFLDNPPPRDTTVVMSWVTLRRMRGTMVDGRKKICLKLRVSFFVLLGWGPAGSTPHPIFWKMFYTNITIGLILCTFKTIIQNLLQRPVPPISPVRRGWLWDTAMTAKYTGSLNIKNREKRK